MTDLPASLKQLPFTAPDATRYIDNIAYYQDVFVAICHSVGWQQHCVVNVNDGVIGQGLFEKLQQYYPHAVCIDGARVKNRRDLLRLIDPDVELLNGARVSPATTTPSQPFIIKNAEKLPDFAVKVLEERLTGGHISAFTLIAITTGSNKFPPLTTNRFVLRSLTHKECFHWLEAELETSNISSVTFTDKACKKLVSAGRRKVSIISALVRIALCIAYGEQSPCVTPRHVTLALREHQGHATSGLSLLAGFSALVILAAFAGYPLASSRYFSSLIAATPLSTHAAPPAPQPDIAQASAVKALQQLWKVWGYDISLDDAFCENAARVNLRCKSGNSSLAERIHSGYPWIAELTQGKEKFYATVVRATGQSLDLLINNQTWQVSAAWFNQHATPRYTLLYKLTPSAASKIGNMADERDLQWLNSRLSRALMMAPLTDARWGYPLITRVKTFQQRNGLLADGNVGESTLMALSLKAEDIPTLLVK